MEGLTLVIPATKADTLPQCLAAVRAAADAPDEIIVVEAPRQAGPAAARNDGARRAAHPVVAFVDADVLVHADAFTRIRAALADPAVTAVFGSYDDTPADPGVVSGFRNLLHHAVHQRAAGPATTFWSGLGAVRRDALLAAGGYDAARYPLPSIEDVDLGMRLTDAGARIVLDPRLLGTHLKRWTLRSMVSTDFRRRAVPWLGLLLRRRRGSTALNTSWRHRLAALGSLAAVGAGLARRPAAAAASLAAMVGLERDLYRVLWRRRGPAQALAGVGLHVVHHLTSAAAVPVALVVEARARRSGAGDADLGAHLGHPVDAEHPGAGPGEVEEALAAERPAVVDADHQLALAVTDQQPGPEGQLPVGGGVREEHVEALAAGGGAPVEGGAVPTRLPA